MNRKPITTDNATAHEVRILRHIEQRGLTSRNALVSDLANPESRIGRGIFNGSNSFVPAIAANWTRRLVAAGLLKECEHLCSFSSRGQLRQFFKHDGYTMTAAGRLFVRNLQNQSGQSAGR